MKKHRLLAFVLAGILMVSMAACTTSEESKTEAGEGLDRLGNISVITREEGSGTRQVFAENLGFFDSSTGRDRTSSDAKQAESGDEVIRMVEEDAAAIGYVSAGTISSEDQKKVHKVTVDGKSLERNFYLAYSGKLTDLESEFLKYVRGAGQEIVGQSYQKVKKVTSFLTEKPSGSIKIGGSSSVYDLMQELAEAYMKINPKASMEAMHAIITGEEVAWENVQTKKEEVLLLGDNMRKSHAARVAKKKCDAVTTVAYNNILHDIGRMGNSCVNLIETAMNHINFRVFITNDEE